MPKRHSIRRHLLVAAGVVLAVAWLLAAFLSFSTQAFENAKQRDSEQLKEVTQQTSTSIRIKMDDLRQSIVALASGFSGYDDLHSPVVLDILKRIAENCDFDRVRLTTPDGQSYSAPGNVIDISGRVYFEEAMRGNSGITDTMISLYNDSVIFVVYAPVMRNGKVIGTLHGACELQTLAKLINVTSFGGSDKVHVFQGNGDIILQSANVSEASRGLRTIWELFRGTSPQGGHSVDSLRQDLINGRDGFIPYVKNGESLLGYYMPMGINNWFLLQVLPISVISVQSAAMSRMAFTLILETLALFLVLTGLLLFFERKLRRVLLLSNREMKINNDRFRIAISHTSSNVFEYDPLTGHLSFPAEGPPPFGLSRDIPDVRKNIMLSGRVAPESKDDFARLFTRIEAGAASVSADIKVTRPPSPRWDRIMLTNIFDEHGKPVRAIGTVEDITERILSERRFLQEDNFRRAMLADSRRVYEINVTRDELSQLSGKQADRSLVAPYTEALLHICQETVHPEDRKAFLKVASLDALKHNFEAGNWELACEYRSLEGGGKPLWISRTTHLLRDPNTSDIMAFTYIRDISEQKERELALRQQAECDLLTGLYNHVTAETRISDILANSGPGYTHGFLSIDLDGFKAINDNFGHIEGDCILQRVSAEFEKLIRSSDVLARMGGDEFLLFLKDVRDPQHIEEVAGRICVCTRSIHANADESVRMSASVGISVYPRDGDSFTALYHCSDIALYEAKRKGRSCYASYEPGLTIAPQGDEQLKF